MNTIGKKQSTVAEDNELDLAALFGELQLNKWFIILIILVALTLGALYAYFKAPQYEADVLLQIDSGGASLAQGGAIEQLVLGGTAGANEALTQTALIQSRFILDSIIRTLHLDMEVTAKSQSVWDYLVPKKETNTPGIQIKIFDVPQNKLNKKYVLQVQKPGWVQLFNAQNKLVLQGKEGLTLRNKKGTVHLKIAAINSPVGSQFIVIRRSKAKVREALLKHLTVQETGAKGRQVGTGVLSVKLTGPDPKQIVAILNQIALTAQAKDIKKKAQEASQTLDFLQQQLPLAKQQLEQAEYQLNRYRAQSGKIDLELQTQALIARFSEIEKEMSRLSIEKVNMQQQYTMRHPMLIAVDQQLKSLQQQRSELEHTLKKLPDSDQVAVNLLREVTVKKELYLILLSKMQELQVAKARTISSLRILALAKPPEEPLPDHVPLIYLTCLVLGFTLSVSIIFVRRMLSSTIEDPHWSEHHLNIPNVAIIPFCKEQKHQEIMAHTNPANISVESLRSLRTSLQISLAGAKNNIVSMLGIVPGVGKTFVSVNIAYLLASTGKKVVLIDTDLRKGTLHQYFNRPVSPGVAEVLQGSSTLEHALAVTSYDHLSYLPRGTYPANPAELLMSGSFKTLLQNLSARFDVVIIDTAPVLLVTDAVIVSAYAGTNYLVLGAGAHQPEQVELAVKRLLGSRVHLHGSIFNYTRPHQVANKYSEYYGDTPDYNKAINAK